MGAGLEGLAPKQARVLDFIQSQPVTPSYRQIMAHCELKSTSQVADTIDRLEARGRIARTYNRARSLRVIDPKPDLSCVDDAALIHEIVSRGFRVIGA